MGANGGDVEMKAVDSPGDAETPAPQDQDLLTLEDIREQTRGIERAVSTKEPRFILRVLRALVTTRKRLNTSVVHRIVGGFYTHSADERTKLLSYLDEPMESGEGTAATPAFRGRSTKSANQPLLPEIDIYLHLLVLLHLIDTEKNAEAMQCSDQLMKKLISHNRRTLDLLAAKCYFYHARTCELNNALTRCRAFLHSRLRTATLRNDFEGQAVLLNCLLRNYLHYNLYAQADKLVAKSTFPEAASNNEWARFLYYLGRIKAIQLNYSEAHKNLLQAIRKAPQYTAVGFKQTVHKLTITVELLLGDIPDRSIFRHATLRRSLLPYFQLTQAVRTGDLRRFSEVLENFSSKFQADHTYTLILRLRHNVIKTGIRMISVSYSRISLKDMSLKLQLDSEEETEFIVAKAIRDKVIEASIDHTKKFMQSKDTTDIYCTREPQNAFHQRITFCLDIHNQSVKAMRFPPKSYNKELESAEDRREREQQDLELAKEMAEDDDDSYQ